MGVHSLRLAHPLRQGCSTALRGPPMHPTILSLALQGLQRAAGPATGNGLTLSEGPDLGWLMGVVMALVVAACGIAFGFRKLLLKTVKQRASRRELQVVDVLPLGGKRQLAVVRCYDRTFALGLGEKDVSLVAELDHEAIELDRKEREDERGQAFRRRLESARERLLGARDQVELEAPVAATPVAPARPARPLAEQIVTPHAPEGDVPTTPSPEVVQREVTPRGGSTKEFIA